VTRPCHLDTFLCSPSLLLASSGRALRRLAARGLGAREREDAEASSARRAFRRAASKAGRARNLVTAKFAAATTAACRRCQTTCCCLLPHRHLHLVRRCSWFILRHLLRLSLRPHRHHRHLLRHSTATLLPLSPSPSSAWSVATTTLRFAHGHWLTSLSPTPPASARASLRARRPALLCVRVRVYGTRDVRMHCIAGRAYWCLSRARAR
jgi:hypothetical protein